MDAVQAVLGGAMFILEVVSIPVYISVIVW